jgi:hypothetical protein
MKLKEKEKLSLEFMARFELIKQSLDEALEVQERTESQLQVSSNIGDPLRFGCS